MTYEDRIQENLNNLGNLDRSDFKYLSENIEIFYEKYTEDKYDEPDLNYVKRLFKLLSQEDFPDSYRKSGIKLSKINGKFQFVNQYNQRCYEEEGYFYITPILEEVDAEKFKYVSSNIRKEYKPNEKWKQKFYNENKYKNYNNYIFDNTCSVSIYNNEIINIFKDANCYSIQDIDLIMEIVQQGGKKIECYEEDFSKYTKLGFMPISICKWDDKIAPKSWYIQNDLITKDNKIDTIKLLNTPNNKLNVKRQDIIFFIYIGKDPQISFNNWIKSIEYSLDYTSAKLKRDTIFNKKGN